MIKDFIKLTRDGLITWKQYNNHYKWQDISVYEDDIYYFDDGLNCATKDVSHLIQVIEESLDSNIQEIRQLLKTIKKGAV